MPRVSKGTRVNKRHKPNELPDKFRIGFLSELDKRTNVFQILKDRYATVIDDCGGEAELSHVKKSLIERFVWLEAVLQDMEIRMASGELPKDAVSKWVQAVNSLVGLARVLGLERVTKSVDLESYLKGNAS